MILSCSNIHKAFLDKVIIDNASFFIEDREKAAIVGINGAGKSTLLKILIGEMSADDGQVILSKGKTMGYLAQHQDINDVHSIYDALMDVKKDVLALEEKIRRLEQDYYEGLHEKFRLLLREDAAKGLLIKLLEEPEVARALERLALRRAMEKLCWRDRCRLWLVSVCNLCRLLLWL